MTPANEAQDAGGTGDAPGHRPLVRIRSDELVADTAQSSGMQRLEAISGNRVGAGHIWMGRTHVPPGARSADHHHGPSETGIHVISGHPVFVFHHDGEEVRLERSRAISCGSRLSHLTGRKTPTPTTKPSS